MALAGCSSLLPGLGPRYGQIDLPESEPPRFRKWIPSRAAFQSSVENDHSGPIQYSNPGASQQEFGQPFTPNDEFMISEMAFVGIEYESYDEVLTNGEAFVALTSVDRDAVGSTLDRTEYDRAGTHRGYDLYTRSDLPRALGVGDDAIVTAPTLGADTVESAVGRVTTTIDASQGRAQRRHEADADFEAITDTAGARPSIWLDIAPLELGDPVTGAASFTFDSETVYTIWDQFYPSADEVPSESDVEERLESENVPYPTDSNLIDIEIDGRRMSIQGEKQATEVLEDTESERPPLITWGVEYDAERSRLTFTHEVGDEVPSARLQINPQYGFDGSGPFGEYDIFGPGDSVTLELTDNVADHYSVHWDSVGGTGTSILHYSNFEK